jgi:hypothetical protein
MLRQRVYSISHRSNKEKHQKDVRMYSNSATVRRNKALTAGNKMVFRTSHTGSAEFRTRLDAMQADEKPRQQAKADADQTEFQPRREG